MIPVRPGNRTLVSVVDDDASVRRALRRMIESAGFRTEAFASGGDLLRIGSAGQPACLVIDVHLGDMNGFQLQRRLAAQGFDAPIIFTTARDDAATAACAVHAGCVAYLPKPIDGDILLDAIRRAVSGAGRPA